MYYSYNLLICYNISQHFKDNKILYGLKPIEGINIEMAQQIIDNRPYKDIDDFYEKNISVHRFSFVFIQYFYYCTYTFCSFKFHLIPPCLKCLYI